MCLQFIVEHVVIPQFNPFLHRYQHFRYFGVYQNHCVSTLKYFHQGEKKKYHSSQLIIFSYFFIVASTCHISIRWRYEMKPEEISFIRTENNPVQGPSFPLKPGSSPGSSQPYAAQGWTDVFLSPAFPNIPKEFNSQDSRPAGFEQPDLSPSRALRVCPSPAITVCSCWSR